MNWILIYIFVGVSSCLVLHQMKRRSGIYEFPFLAGATFLFFVAPQLPALADDPFLPQGSFAKTMILSILCAAMCGLGWAVGSRQMPGLTWTFDERRLLWVAALLSLIGAFFFFKYSRLPEEMTSAGPAATGLPVAYLFLSKLLSFGFAIAVLVFLRRPSVFALLIILYDASYYMALMFGDGRRSYIAEFFCVILLGFWFQRGIAVSRVLAVTGIFAAALAIPSTGNFRAMAAASDGWPGLSKVLKIDVWSNFNEMLRNGGLEMRNAVHRIHFVDQTQKFDYGAWNWNRLVFNFVPAQIVGREFKESLMIPLENREFDSNYESQIIMGTTNTGMADAFASFWYLGALKFFLVAYILGRIYRAAAAGNTAYRIVYATSVTPAMHVITHETQWLVSAWVYTALLVVPLLALARINTSSCPILGRNIGDPIQVPSQRPRLSVGLR
jgi:hypothetical protein